MVLKGSVGGEPVTVSLKPAALSVMFGAAEVLTYDRAGRLYCWFEGGRTLRRGLDGRVLEKQP
ncbi:MAG TPA: radical SAM protein, partial [Roseiflexaceae bacterium]|nr:radical SAM protein [Roseiflexaceae bacterium]